MLRILNSLSSWCDVEMFLQGSSVVQHYVFFLSHPMADNEVLYDRLAVPS